MSDILIVIELENNKIKQNSLEALSTAKKVYNNKICCLISNECENIEVLKKYGADKIFKINNLSSEYIPENYLENINKLIKENDFSHILISNTNIGRDLAPRIAAKIDAEFISDVINIESEGEKIILKKPVYAGKINSYLSVNISEKTVISLRPKVFALNENEGEGEIIEVEGISVDSNYKIIETKIKEGDSIDVAEGDIVVSGGRGLGAADGFKIINELAQTLQAAVGASRSAVDSGWIDHSHQVGQTGKVVSPKLYIAVGISGAIQHLVGMSSAKCVLAINKDKDAPIFEHCDYGIVGDAFQVVPALTKKIKEIL